MSERPIILFGAFDRHNFGDLLLAQVAARQLGERMLLFAGLARRDLRPVGGVAVELLAAQAESWPAADLIHVGGEILGCSAYEAAIMLLDADGAMAAIGQVDRDPAARQAWAVASLGDRRQLPYLLGRSDFPQAGRIVAQAIGGVGFSSLPASLRAEALSALRSMDAVRVRDRTTQAQLIAAGVSAELAPDPAVLTARLFAGELAEHAGRGEVLALGQRYPRGFLAVQCSAEFGDDRTLAVLAGQLDALVQEYGFGVVLFRAGLAPWHDDMAVYRRLAAGMRSKSVSLFESSHLWDICALLSKSAAFIGSSLHGRIVAEAFARPALNLLGASSAADKLAAYEQTWGQPGARGVAALPEVGESLGRLLAASSVARSQWQEHLLAEAGRLGVDRLLLPDR
ncbi:polysaccharide pyruvyl transferase family protein [Azonexus sp. IMCC34839]|uniref:polysaccharide pyruvyl transferase family protein n=1 Tax=Azonexus sp. IMCC34839 TaxID=3133695 RepID=UPI0039995657